LAARLIPAHAGIHETLRKDTTVALTGSRSI
jgi:hypothetical protein